MVTMWFRSGVGRPRLAVLVASGLWSGWSISTVTIRPAGLVDGRQAGEQ